MSYKWNFHDQYAKEFANFPKDQQDKILDFTDVYEVHGFLNRVDVSKVLQYMGKIRVGFQFVGIIPSLISTCKLHDIDPNVYLTDVLQRVGLHPAKYVTGLTPRRWKHLSADNPLKSPLL